MNKEKLEKIRTIDIKKTKDFQITSHFAVQKIKLSEGDIVLFEGEEWIVDKVICDNEFITDIKYKRRK